LTKNAERVKMSEEDYPQEVIDKMSKNDSGSLNVLGLSLLLEVPRFMRELSIPEWGKI